MISAWLLVVAVGSAMVWTVISRAGDDLMPAASASLRASAPSAEKSASKAAPSKPQETAKAILIKSKEPKRSEPPSPSPTESAPPVEDPPSPQPSSPPSRDDDDDNGGGDEQWGDNNKTPPAKFRATWQGVPGAVIAECVGWRISLIGAPANSGYHVDVDTWSGAIRVVFEKRDVSGERTTVFGKCHEGKPIFFDKTDDGSGDDGDNSGE